MITQAALLLTGLGLGVMGVCRLLNVAERYRRGGDLPPPRVRYGLAALAIVGPLDVVLKLTSVDHMVPLSVTLAVVGLYLMADRRHRWP